jgi:hypothetical protein
LAWPPACGYADMLQAIIKSCRMQNPLVVIMVGT